MAARDDHAEPGNEVTRKVLRGLSGPLTMRAGRLWPQADDGAGRLPHLDRCVTGLTMTDSERGWPVSLLALVNAEMTGQHPLRRRLPSSVGPNAAQAPP